MLSFVMGTMGGLPNLYIRLLLELSKSKNYREKMFSVLVQFEPTRSAAELSELQYKIELVCKILPLRKQQRCSFFVKNIPLGLLPISTPITDTNEYIYLLRLINTIRLGTLTVKNEKSMNIQLEDEYNRVEEHYAQTSFLTSGLFFMKPPGLHGTIRDALLDCISDLQVALLLL